MMTVTAWTLVILTMGLVAASESQNSTTSPTTEQEPALVTSHDKVVICYWGTWANYRPGRGKFVADNVDGSLCTHLIYSFAGLDTGTWAIKTLDAWLDLEDNYGLKGFKKATDLKTKYPHLKVMIAIGGWNEGSEKYSQMAQDDEKRSKFVNSTLEFLRKHKFDGLDLDWEYPGKRGGAAADKKNFIKLVKELREAFNEDKFLLTAAIGAAKGTIDISYDVGAMYKYLDFVNVMCYDYHGKWDKKTGHNAPLQPRPDEKGNDVFFNLEYTVEYLVKKGAKPEKTVLGVPLYGRAFLLKNTHDDRMGAPAQANSFAGPYTREAGFLGYNEICEELDKEEEGWEVKWEACHKAPYMVNSNKWVSFDNEKSVKMKADLAWDKQLAGVMVWSIETDDFHGDCKDGVKFPLLRALNTELVRRSEGEGPEEDGETCDPRDYETRPTRRPVVTRKPWSPSPSTSSDISNDLSQDNLPSQPSQPSNSGNVCVKPNEPNADPEDCSKFYLCANGKPHPMSCREGTLYNANVMTCDYPKNVNCNRRLVTPRVNIQSVTEGADVHYNSVTEDLAPVPVYNSNNNIEQTGGLSSEKIAIIVLVLLLLAVCLLLSWCFRDRIKEMAEPVIESMRKDKMAPAASGSGLGLLKPYSMNKLPWYAINKTDQKQPQPVIPSIPKVQIRNYNLRDLPPIPDYDSNPNPSSGPVPPPRRKKSIVEIQNFEQGLTGSEESENSTQSIA